MPTAMSNESTSVKRGAVVEADDEERARLKRKSVGKRGQRHDMRDILETQAKTRARLEPRRGQKRQSTRLLPDLEEEVEYTTLTVPVLCGSAPIEGGSTSGTDVPVNSSVATSVSVMDMVQINVPVPSNVGIQPSSSGTDGSLCSNESNARDFEKLTDLVLTSNALPGKPSRESVQGLERTC